MQIKHGRARIIISHAKPGKKTPANQGTAFLQVRMQLGGQALDDRLAPQEHHDASQIEGGLGCKTAWNP